MLWYATAVNALGRASIGMSLWVTFGKLSGMIMLTDHVLHAGNFLLPWLPSFSSVRCCSNLLKSITGKEQLDCMISVSLAAPSCAGGMQAVQAWWAAASQLATTKSQGALWDSGGCSGQAVG